MTSYNWGYIEPNGPSVWGAVAPAALGEHQSPIAIHSADVVYDRTLIERPLRLSYNRRHANHVVNTGRSLQVDIDGNQSGMQGGPLVESYLLKQFHLHWGSNSSIGAEHIVNNKVYAAELHLVHWNRDKYKTFEEAMKSPHGLAVFAIFVQSGKEHVGLKELTDRLHEVTYKGDSFYLPDGFDVETLLPKDLSKYWTYCGSLTTPPCYESVRFIIFKEPIEISEEQLNCFRSLRQNAYDEECVDGCCHLVDNFRPTMPLNERTVLASFRKFFA